MTTRWQTSPGDLDHVTMSDDVTSSHDNVRVTVWHQLSSDDGIMISVTRFSCLSPPMLNPKMMPEVSLVSN